MFSHQTPSDMDKDIKSYSQEFNFCLIYMLWFSISFYPYKTFLLKSFIKSITTYTPTKLSVCMYMDKLQISLNVNYCTRLEVHQTATYNHDKI
jgi:hypothetical protein